MIILLYAHLEFKLDSQKLVKGPSILWVLNSNIKNLNQLSHNMSGRLS